ncbi:MAG: hypothetical protein JXA89_06755 [Anaerolineae bacterium]|nr:hypothetical protein [Anaerolineae bacterium]
MKLAGDTLADRDQQDMHFLKLHESDTPGIDYGVLVSAGVNAVVAVGLGVCIGRSVAAATAKTWSYCTKRHADCHQTKE